jgi:hypothetical protein
MISRRKLKKLGENTASLALHPPGISHEVTRNSTGASVTRSHRITTKNYGMANIAIIFEIYDDNDSDCECDYCFIIA